MKAVVVCRACGVLSLCRAGDPCHVCTDQGTPPGAGLEPAGVLLEGLDIAGIVAEEGDRILWECARALDLLEAVHSAEGPQDREPIQEGDYP